MSSTDQYQADLLSGRRFFLACNGNRSRPIGGPPTSSKAWAHCLQTLAELAGKSDALAQLVRHIGTPPLYQTDGECAAHVYLQAAEKIRGGYDDVILRSGPESCRFSDAQRPYTIDEVCIIDAYLTEACRYWSDSVVCIGWCLAEILTERGLWNQVPRSLQD